ncbi:MAG: type II toxin-antitoxin system RelE/ParE family toxin [Deltaproteobacteria bacterium]|nr:type II toxin-antitoxin system RelE/ParE family toxin [Deltaproteobacteria bacterium]
MWTLRLSRQAAQFFESLTGKHKTQMAHAFDRLTTDPHLGKTLRGELKGYWSYRVGVYRIIYVIRHTEIVIEVLRVQHRRDVYERFQG